MPISDYDQWNEEAPIVWAAENDFDSPLADLNAYPYIRGVGFSLIPSEAVHFPFENYTHGHIEPEDDDE